MFKKQPIDKSGLEKAIEDLLAEMDHCDSAASDTYATLANRLEQLYNLKPIDHEVDGRERVSADTAAKTGGMLIGIAFIVLYEQKNIFGSKAMTIVQKLL